MAEIEGMPNIDDVLVRINLSSYEMRREVLFKRKKDASIGRIPDRLAADVSPTAIKPQFLPLGPYQYEPNINNIDLFLLRSDNEAHCYKAYKLWSLTGLTQKSGIHYDELYHAVAELGSQARDCYDDLFVDVQSRPFVEMMVLDGCCIIEMFRRVEGKSTEAYVDWMLADSTQAAAITADLLKLENQIPFAVLEKLFNMSKQADEEDLRTIALKFFKRSMPELPDQVTEKQQVKHLLDLVHSTIVEVQKPEPVVSSSTFFSRFMARGGQEIVFGLAFGGITAVLMAAIMYLWDVIIGGIIQFVFRVKRIMGTTSTLPVYQPSAYSIECATSLNKSGIRFHPVASQNPLAVVVISQDSKYQLEKEVTNILIHPITINDLLVTLFINGMAWERRLGGASIFTSYIFLMSLLITSTKDVGLLSSERIITSHGSYSEHDIVTIFNKLRRKVAFSVSGSYCGVEVRDISLYYNSFVGKARRLYFSSPWSVSKFVSAGIILFLTAGGFGLAVLSYLNDLSGVELSE